MAKYRYVQCNFWSDTDMLDLTPEEKYFYLYLLTNENTTQCGIYQVSFKQMEFGTGYNRETVSKLIDRFQSYDKVKYNQETREMAIKNWAKYNLTASPKVLKCVQKELELVKDKSLIPYVYPISILDEKQIPYIYPIDTVSIPLDKLKTKNQKEKSSSSSIGENSDFESTPVDKSVDKNELVKSADISRLEQVFFDTHGYGVCTLENDPVPMVESLLQKWPVDFVEKQMLYTKLKMNEYAVNFHPSQGKGIQNYWGYVFSACKENYAKAQLLVNQELEHFSRGGM